MQIKSFFLIYQSIFRKNIKKIGNFAKILVSQTCFFGKKLTFGKKTRHILFCPHLR